MTMRTRALIVRLVASIGLLALSACSFDFANLHEGGAGGAGSVAQTSAAGPSATTHAASTSGVGTSGVSTSSSVTSAVTTAASSSSTGGGPLSACGNIEDDFSNPDASGNAWVENNMADFKSGAADAELDFFNDSSGFWTTSSEKVALQNCWVSVKIDITQLGTSSSYVYVDWREDDSQELRVQVNKDGSLWGHVIANGVPDVMVSGFAKQEIRFREDTGAVYIETKDPADTTWIVLQSTPSPTWLTKKEAFGFGVEHPTLDSTKEGASFDNVNLPDVP